MHVNWRHSESSGFQQYTVLFNHNHRKSILFYSTAWNLHQSLKNRGVNNTLSPGLCRGALDRQVSDSRWPGGQHDKDGLFAVGPDTDRLVSDSRNQLARMAEEQHRVDEEMEKLYMPSRSGCTRCNAFNRLREMILMHRQSVYKLKALSTNILFTHSTFLVWPLWCTKSAKNTLGQNVSLCWPNLAKDFLAHAKYSFPFVG